MTEHAEKRAGRGQREHNEPLLTIETVKPVPRFADLARANVAASVNELIKSFHR